MILDGRNDPYFFSGCIMVLEKSDNGKYDDEIKEIHTTYARIKRDIENRFLFFKDNGKDKHKAFKEFVFCLLTPQSKARICWDAVERMDVVGVIYDGEENVLLAYLQGVRFKYNKSRYIVEGRKKFLENYHFILSLPSKDAREWLVRNIKGMGYKEASHFLRNVGKGEELAILDRHILKNLKRYRVIEEIPKTLSRRRYLEIEKKMREFAGDIGIPLHHLDLVFWYKEAGEVFK